MKKRHKQDDSIKKRQETGYVTGEHQSRKIMTIIMGAIN